MSTTLCELGKVKVSALGRDLPPRVLHVVDDEECSDPALPSDVTRRARRDDSVLHRHAGGQSRCLTCSRCVWHCATGGVVPRQWLLGMRATEPLLERTERGLKWRRPSPARAPLAR